MANVEDTLNQVNYHWHKDLIIRYLYVKLAPFFKRDLNYYFASEDTRLTLYKAGFPYNSNEIVCKSLADIYQEILIDFNIEAKVIATSKSIIPHFALIAKGEYGWYYLDPLKDLFANQLGLITEYFGKLPDNEGNTNFFEHLTILPDEYIKSLDIELGIKYGEMDDYFERLHQILSSEKAYSFLGLPPQQSKPLYISKINFIDKEIINLGNIPGLCERKMLYNLIIRKLFNKTEKRHIRSYIAKVNGEYKLLLEVTKLEKEPFITATYIESLEDNIYSLQKIK